MKCYIFNANTDELLRIKETVPACGKDYCDRCGECLACVPERECFSNGEFEPGHFWVVYEQPKQMESEG